MKAFPFQKLLPVIAAAGSLFTAVSARAQGGTVNFDNNVPNVVVAPIYGPEPANPSLAKTGNTSAGTPPGSQSYTGPLLAGPGFTAELWVGPVGSTEAQLVRAAGTTFRTGTGAGFVIPVNPVIIPNIPPGGQATFQVRAWDNQGGTLSSWAAALASGTALGGSLLFTGGPLGDVPIPPPPPNLTGLRSFNIHLPGCVPPTISGLNPSAGASVCVLTQATVTFDRPVSGVDAADLLINSLPATGVTAMGNAYTFTFVQPAAGMVTFTWAASHGIQAATMPNCSFNSTGQGATWSSTLNAMPVIISPPQSVTVCAGSSATFCVTNTGTPTASYQWRFNGTNLAGATANCYTISNAQPANAGSYTVVVSNTCGVVTSSAATLTVAMLASATGPTNLTACAGGSATFNANPSGAGPLSFRWSKNGTVIPNATNSTLTVNPVTAADNGGSYCVTVTGPCNSVINCATLTVLAPTGASGPTNRTVCPGGSVTMSTTASGTGPFSYQWTRNGANITGATSSSLAINPAASGDAGTYCVIVTGSCGSVTNCATLTLATPTSASGPTNQTVCVGTGASFTTTASGTGPFTYQWSRNGVNINGATASNWFAVTSIPGTETYCVIVTGACGSVTNCATLTVFLPPQLVQMPSGVRCPDQSFTFSNSASGSGPFTFGWTKNGKGINGATGTSYTATAGSAGTVDTYCLFVTNPCGFSSNCATLTSTPPPTATTAPPVLVVTAGGTAMFTTTASGAPPLTFVWRKDGALLPGQTAAVLNVPTVTPADAGIYTVVVTGPCGSVTNRATLIVNGPAGCDLACAGVDFWLTFPGNYAPDPTNPPVPCLCISGPPGTLVKVLIPGIGFTTNVFLPATQVTNVCLPREADLGNFNDVVTNRAIRVAASAPVTVYALDRVIYTTDGYLAMPTTSLGVEYYVLGYSNVNVGVPELNGSQFAIAACEPNTDVIITPSVPTGARTNGAYTITLQPGDVYQLRNTQDFPADLSGTRIRATAPIAVFAGHRCVNVLSDNQFYCDYLVEQLQPTFMWGTNFLAAPLSTRAVGVTLRVVASQPGTLVTVNGGSPITLGSGQVWQTALPTGARIGATRPVSVMQYANSSDVDGVVNADPFMVLVPPTAQFAATQVVCTASAVFANWIGLIVPAGIAAAVTVDGGAVGPFTPIGASGFSYAHKAVSAGLHTVRAPQPVGVTVYGWAEYESYGWPGCLKIPVAPPVLQTPKADDNLTNLVLTFSKPMSTEVANPANISLSGGLAVTSVQLQPDNRSVMVTTTPQTPGATYTMTYGNTNTAPAHDMGCPTNTLPGTVTVTFPASTQPNPPVKLTILRTGDQVVLSWNIVGCRLQATPALGEPWVFISGNSPVTVSQQVSANRFFRVVCP